MLRGRGWILTWTARPTTDKLEKAVARVAAMVESGPFSIYLKVGKGMMVDVVWDSRLDTRYKYL